MDKKLIGGLEEFLNEELKIDFDRRKPGDVVALYAVEPDPKERM